MADIFISYSRVNSPEAVSLGGRLRKDGFDVWMDQFGIEGSEHWAAEIVEGIRSCNTFLILLSDDAIASEHVLKELTIAAERHKRILPVEIHAIDLPPAFEYPLAGLQRVAVTDYERIVQAHKLGAARKVQQDPRKSLMVLPFEDLSPTQDNEWFADGLVSELVGALSHIKSLHLIDLRTSLDIKKAKPKTRDIARELDVRYFIEGSVRKFGDTIKINAGLLDIETGDYLWQDSHKGNFSDIFEIQESVAQKVVEGLKLHLTQSERAKLIERGTQSVEAFELHLKADAYFARHTENDYRRALSLLAQANKYDPAFAEAYQLQAYVHLELYRLFDRDASHLERAEELALKARALQPDLFRTFGVLASLNFMRGNLAEAERIALEYVERAPDHFHSHFSLALFYAQSGQPEKAIPYYTRALDLKPDALFLYWNLNLTCARAGRLAEQKDWAERAIPYFEKYLRLNPDDEFRDVQFANLLYSAGRLEDARRYLHEATIKDGFSLYNLCCLAANLGETSRALELLDNAISAGFRNLDLLNSDRDLAPLRESKEFLDLVERVKPAIPITQ